MKPNWAREGVVLAGAEYASRVLGFVLSLAIAHQLGVDSLAALTLAIAITGFASVAGDAGLGTHAVRRLVRGAPVRLVVQQTARVQIALTALILLPAWIWAGIAAGWAVATAVAIVPIAFAARAGYVLQAQLRANEYATSRVVGNIATAVMGLVLIALGSTLAVVSLAYGFGAILSLAYVQWRIRVPLRVSVGPPSRAFIQRNWRGQLALAGYTIAVYAYVNVLLVTTSLVGTEAQVNDIAVATRVCAIFAIPPISATAVLLPRFAKDHVLSWHRFGVIGAGAGALAAAIAIPLAPWFVPFLFGSEAEGAVAPTQVLLLEVPLGLLSAVLVARVLGRGRYVLAFAAYGSAVVLQVLVVLLAAGNSAAAMSGAFVVASVLLLVSLLIANSRIKNDMASSPVTT